MQRKKVKKRRNEIVTDDRFPFTFFSNFQVQKNEKNINFKKCGKGKKLAEIIHFIFFGQNLTRFFGHEMKWVKIEIYIYRN